MLLLGSLGRMLDIPSGTLSEFGRGTASGCGHRTLYCCCWRLLLAVFLLNGCRMKSVLYCEALRSNFILLFSSFVWMVPGFHLRTNRFSPLLDRRARIEMDMVLTMQRNTGCPVCWFAFAFELVHQCLWCIIIFVFYFCGNFSSACFPLFQRRRNWSIN